MDKEGAAVERASVSSGRSRLSRSARVLGERTVLSAFLLYTYTDSLSGQVTSFARSGLNAFVRKCAASSCKTYVRVGHGGLLLTAGLARLGPEEAQDL